MSGSLTSATYVRNISYGLRRQLSDFLDPQDRWKDVIVSIRKPSGEPRYSLLHVRRFEGLVTQGKSPTVELLNDWGTTNCTVGELVDILKSCSLLAAASLLLPGGEYSSADTLPLPLQIPPDRDPPTRPLDEMQSQHPPAGAAPETQVLSGNSLTGHTGVSSFMYSELRKITGNFDDRSVSNGGSRLGEGGFGTVYKGFLNNRPVAVKKLNPMDDMPLDKLQDQFNQEIQTLKVLKHENLVDMVGFSCDEQQLCIVYAFMANGSLLDRLACLDGSPPLSWRQRCLITEGTAKGLEYLHSNHHVHRDVKSANILLDENFVAKISDFGLTRASAKHTSTTMMTERVVGTRAYMAPEALRGQITPKSDVFSFGVVLLEILSGRPPADENKEPQFLMDIRDDIDDDDEDLTLEQFLDRKMTDWELSQVESIYCLASNCLDDRKNRRPFIKQVVSEIHSVIKSILLES
ncbi:interleukin-1 receptor-associated kinase 4 isoform X1 [Poeciliopsis prolifica]|uniref:interleukin-1 receptor-associated kinase 4 isoform X1 n=1 Tax=Poeciliopsis prolifica TaxID=188132 RepID=UPI0024138F9B|nr:interleukin-1 receptor-associated kinase 4 isoform X1 [Poeciliopsis prolifica]